MGRLDKVDPGLVEKFQQIQKAATILGWMVVPVHGYRSLEKQAELYAQGRTTPGDIVTHAKPGQSAHNYGLAIDFAFLVNDTYSWDEDLPWGLVGVMAESLGLAWGGRWPGKKRDRPHIQVRGWKDKVASVNVA